MSKKDLPTRGICHAMKIYGYQVVQWETSKAGHDVSIVADPETLLRCRACGATNVVRAGVAQRTLMSLPIGDVPVRLHVAIQRVCCKKCGIVRQGGPVVAAPRRSYTFAFENYVIALSRLMTIQDVAKHLCVGWDTVKAIVKRHLEREYAKPRLKDLRYLGIDEIHVGRMG